VGILFLGDILSVSFLLKPPAKVVLNGKKLKCHPLFPNIFYNKIPGSGKKSGINQARKEKIRRDLTKPRD
jgi:hypothetical protein